MFQPHNNSMYSQQWLKIIIEQLLNKEDLNRNIKIILANFQQEVDLSEQGELSIITWVVNHISNLTSSERNSLEEELYLMNDICSGSSFTIPYCEESTWQFIVFIFLQDNPGYLPNITNKLDLILSSLNTSQTSPSLGIANYLTKLKNHLTRLYPQFLLLHWLKAATRCEHPEQNSDITQSDIFTEYLSASLEFFNTLTGFLLGKIQNASIPQEYAIKHLHLLKINHSLHTIQKKLFNIAFSLENPLLKEALSTLARQLVPSPLNHPTKTPKQNSSSSSLLFQPEATHQEAPPSNSSSQQETNSL